MKYIYRLFFVVFLLLSKSPLYSQWQRYETLSGVSFDQTDIIEYNGILFLTTGFGISHSTDNGSNWQAGPELSLTSAIHFVIHKGVLYAIGGTNFTYYTSNGVDWESKLAGLEGESIFNLYSDNNIIYAACLFGLYISTDDANTWAKVTTVPGQYYLSTLAVSGSTVVTSALFDAPTIYVSNDGTATWAALSTPSDNAFINQIAFQGTNLFISVNGKALYRSTDLGVSWELTRDYNSKQAILRVSDDKIFLAVDKKVLVSLDGGSTWIEHAALPDAIKSTATLNSYSGFLYLGGSPGGLYRKSDENADAWQEVNTGLFMFRSEDIELQSDKILVAGGGIGLRTSHNAGATWQLDGIIPDMNSARSIASHESTIYVATNSFFYRSDDSGTTWRKVVEGLDNNGIGQVFTSGSDVYAVTLNGIYKSVDRGETWRSISQGLTQPIFFANTFGDSEPYALLNDPGGLWRYVHAQEKWVKVTNDSQAGTIGGFAKIGNALFVSTTQGLLRTADDGQSWTTVNPISITGKLTVRHSELYGTTYNLTENKYEIVQSIDSGKTWNTIHEGLPDGIVSSVAVSDKLLVVSFQGKGVWHRDITEIARPFFTIPNLQPDSTFFAGHPISLEVDQQLFLTSGEAITNEDLPDLLSIRNAAGNEVLFTALVYSNQPGFIVTIDNTPPGEQFSISLAAVQNKSGLQTSPRTFRLGVVANNPPSATSFSQSTNQNSVISYQSETFDAIYTDVENQPLVAIKVVTTPAHGRLKLGESGISITSGDLARAQLSDLVYVPAQDFAGEDSWTFNTYDGFDYSSSTSTVSIIVIPTTPPAVGDIIFTLPENGSELFSSSFIIKTLGAELVKVKLTDLPQHGTLNKGTTPTSLNDELTMPELNLLSYTPNANFVGADQWKFTAFDGYNYSNPVTVFVEVTPVTALDEGPDRDISVYPNPIQERVVITLKNSTGKTSIVKVVNPFGQVIIVQEIPGKDTVTLDTSSLSQGVYFIRIDVDNRTVVHKIFKE